MPGVGTLLGLAAVIAGCLIARTLGATFMRRPLSYLGRNTLPIYVQHVILIAAIYTALGALVPSGLRGASALIAPPIAALAAVAVSLAFASVAAKVPILQYAFETPRWFAGNLVPLDPRASSTLR